MFSLMHEVISLIMQLKPLWTSAAGVLMLAKYAGLLLTGMVLGINEKQGTTSIPEVLHFWNSHLWNPSVLLLVRTCL